jgi:transcription termination factor Rho
VTDTQEQLPVASPSTQDGAAAPQRAKRASLSTMLLPELQQLASGLGISTAKVKKSDLVAAIKAAQAAQAGGSAKSAEGADGRKTTDQADAARSSASRRSRNGRTSSRATAAEQTAGESGPPAPAADAAPAADRGGQRSEQRIDQRPDQRSEQRPDQRPDQRPSNQNQHSQSQSNQGQSSQGQSNQGRSNQGSRDDDDDYEGGSSRRRGRRYRDRRSRNRDRGGSQNQTDNEPTVTEDDVLIPVAGILDSVEEKNTWFVRTGGYYASAEDVYVANSYVRKFNLRRGDAVTGAIKQPREGERREKYNPLVRLDTVNGKSPEDVRTRIEFTKLTPLYPQERLRLETEPHILTTRVIDLVMPIGKGQRALIVSPPKAGKTMVLQALANAIATNNPECHLMVVLVDERPEEVTDMQRSVKGEVIASTFDRKPVDHTSVAELSIERAKRLVEMGHDVVVLLDSITRLGRAYNLAAPASGRILSGGIDSSALHLPKRFLGAARNIENGGSLTIIATALVETGSQGDQVIYEEYKGTGNAELRLDRKIADKRVWPAVDVDQSSTRKEEILLSPDELAVTIKLRRVLHALDPQQALDLLLDRLKKTRTNIEFLMQIAKTTPGQE